MHGGELPHLIELELELERMTRAGVVLPTDPFLIALIIVEADLEVVGADDAIRQLSEATAQLAVPVAVVSRVEELPGASFVTLWHGIRDDAVVPGTAVQLDTHANRAPVIAVRQETNFARPYGWIQFVLRFQVRVLVAFHDLEQRLRGGFSRC